MKDNSTFKLGRSLRKKIISSPEWILDTGIYKRENLAQMFAEA